MTTIAEIGAEMKAIQLELAKEQLEKFKEVKPASETLKASSNSSG